MEFTLLKTVPVSDNRYIDVALMNGKKYTFLMHKVSEPNNFAVLKQEEGYTVDTILDGVN